MKIVALALSAALLGVASVSPASALPSAAAGSVTAQAETDGIALAQFGPKKKQFGKSKYRHKYRPGGRYSKAPRGWKRHYKRPSYWETRGCIIVGPIWFCP